MKLICIIWLNTFSYAWVIYFIFFTLTPFFYSTLIKNELAHVKALIASHLTAFKIIFQASVNPAKNALFHVYLFRPLRLWRGRGINSLIMHALCTYIIRVVHMRKITSITSVFIAYFKHPHYCKDNGAARKIRLYLGDPPMSKCVLKFLHRSLLFWMLESEFLEVNTEYTRRPYLPNTSSIASAQ